MKAKIQEELKTAMKARDQTTVDTLRGIISELNKLELDTQKELTEESFVAVVKREIKKRKEAIEAAEKLGRTEIVAQNITELKILEKYLGEQLSGEKLEELVRAAVAGGADNIGKVMGALNREHKGKFDNKLASDLAKRLLEAK